MPTHLLCGTSLIQMFGINPQWLEFYKCIFKPVLWRCWLGDRKGIQPVKNEWWGAGMVICLRRGADLHIAWLIPLPLIVSCSRKSRLVLVLPFWYRLTRGPGSPRQNQERHKMVVVVLVVVQCFIRLYALYAGMIKQWQIEYKAVNTTPKPNHKHIW